MALFENLDTAFSVIQMELKGPDNSLRVRQIRLLGGGIARSFNALAIHQRTCETETLRVFRLLTSQVYFNPNRKKLHTVCCSEII